MLLRRLTATVALLGLMIGAAPATRAAEPELIKPGTLVVGTTGASPPATMYGPDANLIGYDIDLAKKLAADLGLRVEFVTLEWSAMLAGVQAGRFDIVASSVGRTPDRVASASFNISAPYVVNGVAGARRANDNSIKTWEDACGKRVGVVKGANEIRTARAALPAGCLDNIREYPGWSELLLDLQNGRIDILVGNYLTPSYMITSGRRPLAMLDRMITVSTSGIVIRKEAPELTARINALIEKYKADGSLKALTEKYVGQQLDWSLVRE
ncbi:amino acid ABC transporter substrate-binding protein [Acetobacteraceae bacterium H6797]|nr:amino acid ABC transporter substrate-binding protein [Acetobacteraceae bacterium H6797]